MQLAEMCFFADKPKGEKAHNKRKTLTVKAAFLVFNKTISADNHAGEPENYFSEKNMRKKINVDNR